MRIAAGILMIVFSFMSIPIAYSLAEEVSFNVVDSTKSSYEILLSIFGWFRFPVLVSLGLVAGGGICALRKKAWWWALSGAFGCVIIGFNQAIVGLLSIPPIYDNIAGALGAAGIGIISIFVGILAVIFLIMRRREFPTRN